MMLEADAFDMSNWGPFCGGLVLFVYCFGLKVKYSIVDVDYVFFFYCFTPLF